MAWEDGLKVGEDDVTIKGLSKGQESSRSPHILQKSGPEKTSCKSSVQGMLHRAREIETLFTNKFSWDIFIHRINAEFLHKMSYSTKHLIRPAPSSPNKATTISFKMRKVYC